MTLVSASVTLVSRLFVASYVKLVVAAMPPSVPYGRQWSLAGDLALVERVGRHFAVAVRGGELVAVGVVGERGGIAEAVELPGDQCVAGAIGQRGRWLD